MMTLLLTRGRRDGSQCRNRSMAGVGTAAEEAWESGVWRAPAWSAAAARLEHEAARPNPRSGDSADTRGRNATAARK